MTYDLVILVKKAPDVRAIVDSMVDTGPDLRVRGAGGGAVIQLCDEEGRPLVSIEAPQRVDVSGEVERLLGAGAAVGLAVPYWWVEARASEAAEVGDRPAELARVFAAAMVERLGGRVWTAKPAGESGPAGESS